MLNRSGAFLAILSGVIVLAASAYEAKRKGPVIRQVDRILVECSDPKALFSFFSGTIQLPEAWPLADNGGFISGGLGAGNVIIEFFRYASPKGTPARKIREARFSGMAFEPYPLSNALQELQVRGIPYSPPEPYISTLPKGSQGTLWTTVVLPSFSRPDMSIFLYEYSPAFLNVDVRRKQLGNRLTLNNGGPLGFLSVSEVRIAAANLEKEKSAWRQLLGEQAPSRIWPVGGGPAIRLVQGLKDQIQEIAFKVESLDRARAFLKKNNLLESVLSKEVFINPLRIQGLRIRLVE